MTRIILTRIVGSALVVFIGSFVLFFLIRLIPGDPALILAGPGSTMEQIDEIREAWGLNEPLYVQYAIFLRRALSGNLGYSLFLRKPALPEALRGLRYSAALALSAFGVSLLIGLAMGVLSATKFGTTTDNMIMLFAVVGVSMPSFWIGLLLIQIFSVYLRWLPSIGASTLAHAILPVLNLTIVMLPLSARTTRSCMLDILPAEYIRTARAKGLRERTVIWTHALRNAVLPVITVQGVQLGMLIGGAIVTETVFSWPGLGHFLVQAINTRDYPALQAGFLLLLIVISVLNLLFDLSYGLLDPRIRVR